MSEYRIEKDSMGEVQVPAEALYGAQTQRAIDNFIFSDLRLPSAFIHAVVLIKRCAARVNCELGLLDSAHCEAIVTAADRILAGAHSDAFPVDVFQTGSGTSTNMNVNEVLAALASEISGLALSANDHVNMSQSSNDVIPTAIHLSAAMALHRDLLPALSHLEDTIAEKAAKMHGVFKTGRTHLMDAMPLRFGDELNAWAVQVAKARRRLLTAQDELCELSQGGTAVGTGINAPEAFSAAFCHELSNQAGLDFRPNVSFFEGIASQDTAVVVSGQLKALAVTLMKISNDLRWMNSGPLAGLGEIRLPALQPGSSIMPGKVNPVIPEAAAMAAAQVVGNDACIAVAGQSGNFQLNVMLPVIAYNLLQSIDIMGNASRALADKAIAGFTVDEAVMTEALSKNPILVTALNRKVGYLRAAEVAKQAYAQGRPIVDVAAEMLDLSEDELTLLLDPEKLADGGVA